MLQFEHLCACYDREERLHDVSAELRPGRLTAIIGPNGCGKSTLLKCLTGHLKPSGGTISLDGRMLRDLDSKERARLISYMPQSRIIPEISVRQLVSHGRYPHLTWGQRLSPCDREIIARALERTGLTADADRPVSSLSGGERQRAYLAMMLAQQTPVMLLDEPTTYLDLSAQFSLMELLRELCAEGHTAAVVLHDLALALEYADDVLLMRNGRIVSIGTPQEIYLSGRLEGVFDVNVHRLDSGKYVFSRHMED